MGPQLDKKLHPFYATQRFITMHARALSLCSFLSVRDQVSYPQRKQTGKITISYILISVFLNIRIAIGNELYIIFRRFLMVFKR